MNGQVTIIKRTSFGYLTRLLYGLLALAVLFGFLWFVQYQSGSVPGEWLPAVLLYVLAVFGVTAGSIFIYSLSYVELSDNGVTVHAWLSPFIDSAATAPWFRITSVDSEQGGVVSELVGYGTLIIQQAGTQQPLRLTYVARVDFWSNVIEQRANTTPAPVHNE